MCFSTVLPPANVTLLCHNMQNTLQWTYEPPSDGVKFKVTVGSFQAPPVSLLVDSPVTSIDLSEFSDPGNEYSVHVSAVKGLEESDPVPDDGIDFSYYKDATAAVICAVDFPLVNITREDKLIHFRFTHPGLIYLTGGKTMKKKSLDSQTGLPDLDYHIEVINEVGSYTYSCSETVCWDKLPVPDNENKYCLNIRGEMNNIQVQALNTYCSEPQETPGIS
ncbi:hypothetical protein NQD34_006682 [Periophthalmus magnuspinnatus]|nr:hypothetical protein NQD34_006682 [Periophthalmus magnuspinnatus]